MNDYGIKRQKRPYMCNITQICSTRNSLAITISIKTAIGMLDNNAVFASKPLTACGLNCSKGGGS